MSGTRPPVPLSAEMVARQQAAHATAALVAALDSVGLSIECFSTRCRPGITAGGQPVVSLGRITALTAYRVADALGTPPQRSVPPT
jgi:hypothetical protein